MAEQPVRQMEIPGKMIPAAGTADQAKVTRRLPGDFPQPACGMATSGPYAGGSPPLEAEMT